ncbi:pentapeptide repeat-containing protein [Catenulispora sp. EB89]|uniref:pentapeptide repeat-containing protein n=1 Tax=Catenulispora sp. EB89 TaxID=3156257 RepID=UPI0035198238
MAAHSNTEGSIVHVRAHGGKSAGVGVMVSLNEFVTCAHVVNVAMGLDPRSQSIPRGLVEVAFPLRSAQPSGIVLASVTLWRPPPQEGVDSGDLARLRIRSDVRPEPVPARLFPDPVRSGLKALVFGFPTKPARPGGAWAEVVVRNRVGGGRLQVDSAHDSAVRIQPGFSGSPVIDMASGYVLGIVSAAPSAASGERDAYAISVQELSTLVSSRDLHLPDAFSVLASGIRRAPVDTVNVLHVSDTLFGSPRKHGGSDGALEADTDVLFDGLLADLADTVSYTGVNPDLVVVAGNLAASGKPSEFSAAGRSLSKLGVAVGLPRDRMIIVPGSQDVNRSDCAAYHLRQEGNEKTPLPPFWPKWEKFDAMFREFYRDRDGTSFTPDEPWTLFEIPDLCVVVAGFNSTIAECHQNQDRNGFIGSAQMQWFAERLVRYRDEGWLRLATVHHNLRGAADPFGENLHDASDLERMFGEEDSQGRRLIQVLFHGRGTDGCARVLPSGIAAISSGASAMVKGPFADVHPQQYQLVEINRDGITQHGRIYNHRHGQWTGDMEVSESRSSWQVQSSHQLSDSVAVFADPEAQLGWGTALDMRNSESAVRPTAMDGLLEQVREVTAMLHQHASIVVCTRDGRDRYLRVTSKLADEACEQWAVGVVEGVPDRASIDGFVRNVHDHFAAADPGTPSKLVYFGEPAAPDLVHTAISSGVRLIRFIEYQGIADLSAFDKQQRRRLATDQRYPSRLYVPQRFLEDNRSHTRAVKEDLLERVLGWLADEQAMFIMVLGDFGRGKTFLLNELCRRMPDRLPSLQPILVELRHLEKRPSLDELLSQHLVRMGERQIDLEKLRYLVRSGRIALLFDGFDELVLRISYDNAALHLRSLIDAASGQAKIVLTSRTQHFRSEQQVRTALGERVIGRDVSRVVELADFSDDQIHDYLVKYFGGDVDAAAERYTLLQDIKDLLGLSHNPRMLSFIVGLDIERLREIRNAKGRISAADLYQELIARWLAYEAERQHHDGGLPSFSDGDRRQACEALAVALWSSPTGVITLTDLSMEVSHALVRMFDYGYSSDQATQAIGSGSLLVRTADDEFDFVHRSVMEWLVADAAARFLKAGVSADVLSVQPLSPLMIDFLGDLAGTELVMAWAERTVQDGRAPAPARQNAAAIILRLSQNMNVRVNLAGIDLRGLDLSSTNLRGADLQLADFRGMRLVDLDLQDADLRGADFTGAWMIKGSLTGTSLTGSRWERAALVGVAGIEDRPDAVELRSAAVVGRDAATPARPAGGRARSVAGDLGVNGLVAVSRHQSVEIVDTVSAQTLRVLTGHTAPVLAVAVSRDGRLVASASADHSVRVWTMTGELQATFTGHSAAVTAVTFTHNGALVATGSADGSVRFWSVGGGSLSELRLGQRGAVTAMAFSADDDYLVFATAQGIVSVLDARNGGQTLLGEHPAAVTCVAMSSDGQIVATGCKDGIARLWERSGAQLAAVPYLDASVEAVAFSQEGNLVAVTVGAGRTRVCDAHRGVVVADVPQGAVGVALASNAQAVALVLPGGELATWQGAGEFQLVDSHRAEPISSVAFAPDGRLIATTGDRVWAWDTRTGQATVMRSDEGSAGSGAILTSDGRWVALQDSSGAAHIWSTAPARRVITVRNAGRLRSLAVSRDGTMLATTSWNGPSRLWSVLDGREIATLTTYESSRVAFAPDGQLAVTGFKDGSVSLYNQSGFSSGYSHQAVDSVAFTSDGARMASASRNGSVRIWDTRGRSLRKEFRASATVGVVFSPDGGLIATVSSESMRVWDCVTGRCRLSLSDSAGLVTGGAFSADGTQIATSAMDGSIRLWDASGRLLATFVVYPTGTAVLLPDGSYKVQGDVGEGLWWAVKLCRFRPGEIDRFYPNIKLLAADEPILS